MKKLILLLSVIHINYCLIAQSTFDYSKHLKQYWNYKYALLGDGIDPNYYRWESGIFETIINIKYATQ